MSTMDFPSATTIPKRLLMQFYSKSMPPGSNFEGAFHPIDWMWDGVVKKFVEDGSWDFQQKTSDGNYFWTSGGPNDSGSKMEHNAPCPYGMSRFAQGSTAGWIGIYDFSGVKELLDAADGAFPDKVPASYTLLQGEQDITAQIELGGKGLKANGYPQTTNSDSGQEPGKVFSTANEKRIHFRQFIVVITM